VGALRVQIKRVYDQALPDDGKRILIDRLWPRGLTKEKARIDLWLKEIAPSTELREWFGHDPAKWPEFQKRYRQELDANEAVVGQLRTELKNGPVTLVFGAKDEQHNDAVVLQEYLEQ
jgi:uncharacterized protein YeaO (DUF488 family)